MSVYSVLTKRKGSSIENTQPIRRPRIDVDSDLIVIGSSPSTNEKIRAMPEQCRIAEQFLREDQYNTDAWVVLLDHAAQATPIDEVSFKTLYLRFVFHMHALSSCIFLISLSLHHYRYQGTSSTLFSDSFLPWLAFGVNIFKWKLLQRTMTPWMLFLKKV